MEKDNYAKFPLIESMTKIVIGEYSIRVWRAEEELKGFYENKDIFQAFHLGATLIESIKKISELPRVNAVEVVDGSGDGVVYYTDWP